MTSTLLIDFASSVINGVLLVVSLLKYDEDAKELDETRLLNRSVRRLTGNNGRNTEHNSTNMLGVQSRANDVKNGPNKYERTSSSVSSSDL